VAGFSPFHFHRLFKAITDETINDMVTRLRLERAVVLLRATPQLSITEAAFASGFKSVPVFSRAFKRQYGINARQWDRQSPLKNSKNGQVLEGFTRYTLEHLSDFAERDEFKVYIRSLPEQRLAYIRVYDSYSKFSKVSEAYYHLIAWYRQRGGSLDKTTLYGMSQDDPEVTPLRLCRYDWCLRVPADWQAEGDVSMQTFPACQVAIIRCKAISRRNTMLFNTYSAIGCRAVATNPRTCQAWKSIGGNQSSWGGKHSTSIAPCRL
jgi:AraC family transcriptional regulator